MRKPTGQMREETQELLDEYNELYNWEYDEMCDFIENYGETEFLTYYETYHRLVDDYGQNLVDEFAQEFDVDSVDHFEDIYQGQYNSGETKQAEISVDREIVSPRFCFSHPIIPLFLWQDFLQDKCKKRHRNFLMSIMNSTTGSITICVTS